MLLSKLLRVCRRGSQDSDLLSELLDLLILESYVVSHLSQLEPIRIFSTITCITMHNGIIFYCRLMKDQTPDLLELLAALIQILVRDLELHIDFFDVGNTVATIGSLSRHRILLFICVDYHAPIPATLAGIIVLSCCIGLLKFLDLLLRGLGQVIQLR